MNGLFELIAIFLLVFIFWIGAFYPQPGDAPSWHGPIAPRTVYAAQPHPAGTQTLTSVVGKQWAGVRFRVEFDNDAIKNDPTMVITVAISIAPDGKNFRTVTTGHIIGGAKMETKGDSILSYPVQAGYTARLTVTHNKDLVFNMSMGAK